MKINIGGYDVEIKAKLDFKAKNNEKDTLAFLNYLSLVFEDASKFWETQNGPSYKSPEKRASEYLYNYCKDHGLYG